MGDTGKHLVAAPYGSGLSPSRAGALRRCGFASAVCAWEVCVRSALDDLLRIKLGAELGTYLVLWSGARTIDLVCRFTVRVPSQSRLG